MQQAVVTRGRVCTAPARGPARTYRARSVVVRAAGVAQDKFIPPWRDVYGVLKSKELRTIAPEEAADLLKTGQQLMIANMGVDRNSACLVVTKRL